MNSRPNPLGPHRTSQPTTSLAAPVAMRHQLRAAGVMTLIVMMLLVLTAPRVRAQPVSAPDRAAGLRDRVVLDGKWEGALAPPDQALPEIKRWEPTDVPGVFRVTMEEQAKRAWVRRGIDIPAAWLGRRVFLRINGALYHPHIYIDGQLVGSQLDGWSPIELELTDAVTPGKTHELAVMCQDQSAVYADGVPRGQAFTEESRRGKVLALIGGYKDFLGIWDRVELYATPQQRIVQSELIITPSTRKQSLQLEGKVDGGETKSLLVQAVVIEGDQVVLTSKPVAIDAEGAWSINESFKDARYWSPEDPHLYTLQLNLLQDESGPQIDRVEQRFGFKEFWIEGPDFYLNGVKRHLLGDSHWPPPRPVSDAFIRNELETFKKAHINTFRTHIGGWQRRWYELADEIGMMIVPEAPAYTDGSGFYAYDDPRFWENYRDNVTRMIRTYRNHPSTTLYSLGNEILFMGNAGRATDLPKKLGDLARYARTVDPHHPLTFDADLNPDGAYDVIGLHYPHELPDNFAYPNTGDWLAQRKRTEAGGGMLGQARSDFFWDRTQPLNIGEYLWCPFEDYSPGSVYFGDRAYENRLDYWVKAKYAAQFDQTIAYRRAGVSGLCPWATSDTEQEYFRHVAAVPYSHDRRVYAGDVFTFKFDVFNDSPAPLNLTLQMTDRDGKVQPLVTKLTLEPAGYQRVNLPLTAPQRATHLHFDAVLLADGKPMHESAQDLEVWSRDPLATPEGRTLVVYDPSGAWPGSVSSLGSLAGVVEPSDTLLLIAADALGGASAGDAAVIGANTFDTAAFLNFITRGGRAIVLEQRTLRPLGLDLSLVEHASTMTHAIDPSHPLLAGLDARSLRHWRDDHYVSHHELVRPAAAGARTVVVSGGPKSLDQGPVVEMPVGRGHVVLIQALAGRKRDQEPAAARLVQNAVNYLAAIDAVPNANALVISDDPAFVSRLREMKLAFDEVDKPLPAPSLSSASLVVIHGGGDTVRRSAGALAGYLQRGGRLYWHQPDPATFEAVDAALDLNGLTATPANTGTSILMREHPLLRGLSREDLTYTTTPQSWRRSIAMLPSATVAFIPASPSVDAGQTIPAERMSLSPFEWVNGGELRGDAYVFDKAGMISAEVDVAEAGLYPIRLRASASGREGRRPQVQIHVEGAFATSLYPAETADYPAMIALPAGKSKLTLMIDRGDTQGEFGRAVIHSLTIKSPARYPSDVEVLTLPGSLVAVGDRIVLDGTPWEASGPNAKKTGRYASALLANLGARFEAPTAGPVADELPLRLFKLIGESPWYEANASRLIVRSNGLVEAPFEVAAAGRYRIGLRGHSTPVRGVFCKVRVLVDGRAVGEAELSSEQSADFEAAFASIERGKHTLGVQFFNDAAGDGEDRNLVLEGVSFTAEPTR